MTDRQIERYARTRMRRIVNAPIGHVEVTKIAGTDSWLVGANVTQDGREYRVHGTVRLDARLDVTPFDADAFAGLT